MATLNIGMKVNRAITGATTVTANSYAIVTYGLQYVGNSGLSSSGTWVSYQPELTRYFGPGQSIPSTFTVASSIQWTTGGSVLAQTNVTYGILSGVELINTQ